MPPPSAAAKVVTRLTIATADQSGAHSASINWVTINQAAAQVDPTSASPINFTVVFNEVVTGFRFGYGGAQEFYGVTPDLSTFGKIIGGGMPVGCFGGKRAIMQHIAPLGPVYQAGTLSGNPLAMAAGLTTLGLISRPGFHDELSAYTSRMLQGLQDRADAAGIPFVTTQVGGMFGLYFSGADDIVTFADVMASDADRFKRFFHLMLEGGVYLAPSAFEAGFTSIAHGDTELAITLDAAERAFAKLK